MFSLYTILLIVIFVISVSLHEYAHAWMANRLGDPTPRMQGRLTPNPIPHIDIFGLIAIFLIGFGWAKPVMTNPAYFRDPVKGDFLTAMAGPAMNFLLVIAGMIIIMIYGKIAGYSSAYALLHGSDLIINFWLLFMGINIALAVFNLLPIYPLDGYRIVKIISPSAGFWMEKNGMIISIVALALIFSNSNLIGQYISFVTEKVMYVFGLLLSQIFY